MYSMSENTRPVHMSSPDITNEDVAAVQGVLGTRHLSIGPQVDAFEQAIAQYVGTHHAAAVNSGTSGLHLAVIAASVRENDLVITTPFSFVASANCILYERAVPIFVDVDPRTGNINPELASAAIDALTNRDGHGWLPRSISQWSTANHQQLRAVLPVHAFGQPADMDPIVASARAHGLAVIEDACEALGATYKGRMAGTLGDAAVFAFYPNKQMTTGEGGMLVTDHDESDALFRSLRNQGRAVGDRWLNHTHLGYNYRLDEMSAALGLTQLQRIEALLSKRERVAQWYNAHLANHELIETPSIAPTTTRMSWFVYVVRVRRPLARDDVMRALAARGIPSRPYFTPIHLQPFYVERFGYRRGDFPITEALGDTSLALPFSGVMLEEEVTHVCHELEQVAQALYTQKSA